MRKSPALADQQIEALVSQICEPDKTEECDALQVLLQEIDQALADHCADPHEAINRAGWILQVARARAFAMFPEELETRAQSIRARFFGDAPAVKRRKPLRTRAQR